MNNIKEVKGLINRLVEVNVDGDLVSDIEEKFYNLLDEIEQLEDDLDEFIKSRYLFQYNKGEN